jgi:hypothetical protein
MKVFHVRHNEFVKDIWICIQDDDELHAESHQSIFINMLQLFYNLNLDWMKFEVFMQNSVESYVWMA